MTNFRVWLQRLIGLSAGDRQRTRIQEELETHIQMLAAELEQGGMTPQEARVTARRSVGNATQVAEDVHEQSSIPLLESIWQDLRYAIRQLRTHPGFTAAAVMTLALGIGANTAIFQLLDRIVLRPLPVKDPSELVVAQGFNNDERFGFSYPRFREMNRRQTVVEGLFVSAPLSLSQVKLDDRLLSAPPQVYLASGNYFRLIGTDPQRGRLFTEDDDTDGADPVAVLSDRFWRSEMAARPDAIGSTIQLNDQKFRIIGITRPDFTGERIGTAPDVWVPLIWSTLGISFSQGPSMVWLDPMARLRDNVPQEQAELQLSRLWEELKDYSTRMLDTTSYRLELLPGHQGLDTLRTQFSQTLWILFGITGLVGLLASCNLGNLLLARARSRMHEMAVRISLGASRPRIVRQLLIEALLLSALGGAAGAGLAMLASHELIRLASAGETWSLDAALDWRGIAFTFAISVIAVLFFGLAPALSGSRTDPGLLLSSGRDGGRHRWSAVRGFVAAQVCLSLLLVCGASLLVRSFWDMTHQDLGYRTDDILLASISSSDPGDFRISREPETLRAILYRATQIPGVKSAGIGATTLLDSHYNPGATSAAATPQRSITRLDGPRIVAATEGFQEAMGIRLLQGRSIERTDTRDTPRVAVVSVSAARLLFEHEPALGKTFHPSEKYQTDGAFTVVGIMEDIHLSSLRGPADPLIFAALPQWSPGMAPNLALRFSGDSASVINTLREAIAKQHRRGSCLVKSIPFRC